MIWKLAAEEDLRAQPRREVALQNLSERIETLTSRIESPAAAWPSGGGKASPIPADERLAALLAERERLREARRLAARTVRMVRRGLATLDDDHRLALQVFYQSAGTHKAERLAEALNIERSTAYRLRDEALQQFALAMFGN